MFITCPAGTSIIEEIATENSPVQQTPDEGAVKAPPSGRRLQVLAEILNATIGMATHQSLHPRDPLSVNEILKCIEQPR